MTEERKRSLVRDAEQRFNDLAQPAWHGDADAIQALPGAVEALLEQQRAERREPGKDAPVPRDDDGHPDARVQQALDALDEALADWSYDGGFPNRAYFLLLATKDAEGSGFRSVSRHEMTVEQALAMEHS